MNRLMGFERVPGCFHRRLPYLCSLLLMALLAGCAGTATTIMDEEVVTNQKPMATYTSLVIHDFELKNELFTDTPDARMSEREQRYVQIPEVLAENIERYVNARHIYQDVSRNAQPSANALVLKGKFTRVGRFRISIIAKLYDGATDQEVAYFRQTLWDVLDTTEGVNLLGRDIADFIGRIQYK
jgi:hypothetical protein